MGLRSGNVTAVSGGISSRSRRDNHPFERCQKSFYKRTVPESTSF